jgi:hypothetical protein
VLKKRNEGIGQKIFKKGYAIILAKNGLGYSLGYSLGDFSATFSATFPAIFWQFFHKLTWSPWPSSRRPVQFFDIGSFG